MEKQHDRFLYLGTKYKHEEVNPMVYFITINLIIALLFNLPTACYTNRAIYQASISVTIKYESYGISKAKNGLLFQLN